MKGESLLFASIFGSSSKITSAVLYVLSLIGPIDSNRTRAVINKQVSLKRTFTLGLLKKKKKKPLSPWEEINYLETIKQGLWTTAQLKHCLVAAQSWKAQSEIRKPTSISTFQGKKSGNKKHTFTSRFESPPDCHHFNYILMQWHNSITAFGDRKQHFIPLLRQGYSLLPIHRLPGIRVVQAGLINAVPQNANVSRYHVIQSL